MFSSSALGGSICLRCQIRAVTRRAPPLLAAAPIRSRRRQYASDATTSRPDDTPPSVEIKEHGLQTEQRPEGSPQPQLDGSSPSVIPGQTLSDPPRDALGNALGLPNRSVTEDQSFQGLEKRSERDQSSRVDVDIPESALTSEPDYKVKARRDEWKTNQGKALSVGLKSPRDLTCPTCGLGFGTKKLLHRHTVKSSCFGKAKPEKFAEIEDGHKIEDALSRAAADFSRNKTSSRGKYATTDDWSLPQRQGVRPQAAPADGEPGKSAGENDEVAMKANTHIDPEIKSEKTDISGKKVTTQEGTVRVRGMGNEMRAEMDSDDTLIRKIGKDVRNTRGRKREHRRGDMLLVEDASRLSVDSLGKAAEVIVLRDGRQWTRRARPVEASSEKVTDDGLNMEDFLNEQDLLSLDDVLKNIHGLKPERQIVSAREYKSLFNTLLSGFTILQLEKYVVWHREQPILETIKDDVFGEAENPSEGSSTAAEVLPKRRQYAWMTEEAHWTPHVDGAVEEAHYPLAGYITRSMPPKQRLVVQLMRECWNISIQELLDGSGRLDIRVRDLEFKILTLGSQSWLRDISRRFLEEGQQIEVRRSSNLVRISAPKSVAETCVNRLDHALQKIKTRTLEVDQVPVHNIDAATLEELGRITNSVVQFGPGRKTIHITWIDVWDEESQSTLENVADRVLRLLLTANPPARTWNNLTVYPDAESNGKLIEDHNNKEKLSWSERRSEWARLCLPLTSKQHRTAKSWPLTTDVLQFKVEPTEKDLALPVSTYQRKLDKFYQTVSPLGLPKMEKEQPKEQVSLAQEPEATDTTPSGWRPFKITTNAAFGHVLHLNRPKLAENIALPDISTTLANCPRTFAPLIPPVAELALPGWAPYDGTTKGRASTILMRFVPYSEDVESAIYTDRAPPLELRLSGNDLEVTAIHSLRAINRASISDILLPAEHVDVRMMQQEYAELSSTNIDSQEGMEPLREFLNKSRFDLRNGKLKTPSRLHNLGLPRWLLAPPLDIATTKTNSRVGAKKKRAAADAARPPQNLPHSPESNELRRASYVFAGLEFRYAVETTYDGWKLVYTSIEGGAGGGRRAELSLDAVPGYDAELRRAKEAINTTFFLRSVYQLATGQPGHLVKRADGEEQVRTSISWVR